jgi:hypothetical protein
MNISPHQQRTTKYPWPGLASALVVVVAVVLVLFIGFVLIADPFGTTNEEPEARATQTIAAYGL